MGGVAVGLLFGAGLACCWWSCWPRVDRPAAHGDKRNRLRDDVVGTGLPGMTVARLIAACTLLGLAVAVAYGALTGVWPLAVGFGLGAGAAPVLMVRSRARSRRAVLREIWPDVVDLIGSAVRAGMSLPEAVAQVGARGPEELRPPFAAFGRDYQASGRFSVCLDRLKDRLADPVGDRLVESLRIARDVGGTDLGRLLRTLSAFLREDARTRAELEARQSWTVNAARLAVAAPWAVLAMLSTRPDSVRAYASGQGALLLAVGAVVCAVAYRMMIRLGRLPEDDRVLR